MESETKLARILRYGIGALLLGGMWVGPARAGTNVWNGSGWVDWAEQWSWDGYLVPANDTVTDVAQFNASTVYDNNPAVLGNRSVGGIDIQGSGYQLLSFNPGVTLTLGIYGLTGTGGLTLSGAGTLLAQTTNAATFAGGLRIEGGATLRIQRGGTGSGIVYGFGTGGITLDGGTLYLDPTVGSGNNINTFTNALNITGSGGTITVIRTGGSDSIWTFNGPLTLGGNLVVRYDTGKNGPTFNGGLQLVGGNRQIDFDFTSNAAMTLSSNFTQDGSARQLTLNFINNNAPSVNVISGVNTGLTGGIVLSASGGVSGGFQFSSTNALGGGGLTIGARTFASLNFSDTNAVAVVLSKITSNSTGVLGFDSGIVSNNINLGPGGLNADLRVGSANAATYRGTLTPYSDGTYKVGGGGGTLTFDQVNAFTGDRNLDVSSGGLVRYGTIVLNSRNNYTGTTTIGYGMTVLSPAFNSDTGVGPFGDTGAVNVGNGAKLEINGGRIGGVPLTWITFQPGSTLQVDTIPAGDRLANAATVTVNNATISFTLAARNTQATETFGDIAFRGGSALFLNIPDNSSNPSNLLAGVSLTRQGRGTLRVISTNQGGTDYFQRNQLTLSSAPAVVNGMIAPYYYYNQTTDFLTYNGALTNATYSINNATIAQLVAATPTDVVYSTEKGSLTGNVNVYALKAGASLFASGANTNITLGSGGLILRAPGNDDGGNSLYQISANLTFPGVEAVVIANSSGSGSGNWKLTGVITGTNGFTKAGDRPLILKLASGSDWTGAGASGDNGILSVNEGRVYIAGGAFPSTSLLDLGINTYFSLGNRTYGASGSDYGGRNITLAGLTGVGSVINDDNVARTLTINTPAAGGGYAGSYEFSGVIADSRSALNLVKAGAGWQTFRGTETFTGTATVSNGTLEVIGALPNAGNITVVSNAVLRLTGSIGSSGTLASAGRLVAEGTISRSVSIGSSGTLEIGTGPSRLFVDGSLTLQTNATWVVDLVGTEAGTGYDQIVVAAGQFAFGHAELRIGLDPTNAVNRTEYAIGHITGGGGASVGRFWFDGAAVEEGMTNSFGSAYEYVITYKAILDVDGQENDIVLTLIPEPSALALVGAGLLLLLATRCPRNRATTSSPPTAGHR